MRSVGYTEATWLLMIILYVKLIYRGIDVLSLCPREKSFDNLDGAI